MIFSFVWNLCIRKIYIFSTNKPRKVVLYSRADLRVWYYKFLKKFIFISQTRTRRDGQDEQDGVIIRRKRGEKRRFLNSLQKDSESPTSTSATISGTGSLRAKQRQPHSSSEEKNFGTSTRAWFKKLRDGFGIKFDNCDSESTRYVNVCSLKMHSSDHRRDSNKEFTNFFLFGGEESRRKEIPPGSYNNLQLYSKSDKIEVGRVLSRDDNLNFYIPPPTKSLPPNSEVNADHVIEVILRKRKANEKLGLGISIEDYDDGDSNQNSDDSDGDLNRIKSVRIKAISPSDDSLSKFSQGFLLVGDEIIAINDIELCTKTRHECLELLQNSLEIRFLIRRIYSNDRHHAFSLMSTKIDDGNFSDLNSIGYVQNENSCGAFACFLLPWSFLNFSGVLIDLEIWDWPRHMIALIALTSVWFRQIKVSPGFHFMGPRNLHRWTKVIFEGCNLAQ